LYSDMTFSTFFCAFVGFFFAMVRQQKVPTTHDSWFFRGTLVWQG
jgi:hypothetical protein